MHWRYGFVNVESHSGFIAIRGRKQIQSRIVDVDLNRADLEYLVKFVAHQVNDGVEIEMPYQPFLHAVDDGEFRVALFGLFEQALSLLEEAHIFDGDCGLVGKGFHEVDLFLSEWNGVHAANEDGANALLLPQQWNRQKRAIFGLMHRFADREFVFDFFEIRNMQGRSFEDRTPRDRIAIDWKCCAEWDGQILPKVRGATHRPFRVNPENGGLVGIRQPRRIFDDRVQHGLNVGG